MSQPSSPSPAPESSAIPIPPVAGATPSQMDMSKAAPEAVIRSDSSPVPTVIPVAENLEKPKPPSPVPVLEQDPSLVKKVLRSWRKIGGGSLMVSLLIHAGILIAAVFVVQTIVTEAKTDFLPGGGSKSGADASQALSQQVQAKKRSNLPKSTPMRRIVSNSSSATVALPDLPADTIDMPEMGALMSGGSMGSGGFSSQGSGGGFGNGMGIGGLNGVAFKPIFMFGQDLKARSIGVVMDVSGSMTPHLTKVIKELDRVAKGSPVVLYVGCGIMPVPRDRRLDDKAMETLKSKKRDLDKNFEIFWRRNQGQGGYVPPKKEEDAPPIPSADVYEVMANRKETFFLKSQGIQFSWLGLMADELKGVEAVYWFSDFQDAVDDEQMEEVAKHLKRRKQKLFIHASVKGASFSRVRDNLVLPSGGEVIEGK